MKKIISIILTILTLFSLTATTAMAKTKAKAVKKDPKTYYAVYTKKSFCFDEPLIGSKYTNSRGTASIIDGKFVFTNLKGKKYLIEKDGYKNKKGKFIYTEVDGFYVRLDKIYYTLEHWTYDSDEGFYETVKRQLKVSSLDGKTKKVIAEHKYEPIVLFGGYGSSVIYQLDKRVYKWYKEKTTKLYNKKGGNTIDEEYETSYFNGKLYHDNKVYNLKTGKTKSFVASQTRNSKKYLYYINKNGNLKRLDKQGNRETVDSKGKIEKIYLVNAGQTVIYSKGTGEKETFYRRTGVKKEPKRLVSLKEMVSMMGLEMGHDFPYHDFVDEIILHDYKVYFHVISNYKSALFSVGVNGNNLTLNIQKGTWSECSVYKSDGKIVYSIYDEIDGDLMYGEYEYFYF